MHPEQRGRSPSHRVLLLRQFVHAIWIFLRLGFGDDVSGCGISAFLAARFSIEGDDGGTSIIAESAVFESNSASLRVLVAAPC